MHFTVLSASIALALAGVRAQLPPQVTPCIETCLAQAAAEDLDGCSVTDVQCLCANKKIQQDVFSCLQQQCSTQEFEEVQVFVAAECAPPASSTSSSTSARATSPITTTHSEAPSTIHSEAPSTIHTTSSSEERTSERTSVVLTTIAPSTRLTSVTTTVNATSLANATSLLSTASTAPVALSTSSNLPSSSSSASITVSSASPARTNAAPRVGPGAVGMLALGAVLGGAAVW